jgi:hypothetical protein
VPERNQKFLLQADLEKDGRSRMNIFEKILSL